jgi:hypothetical protein
MGPTLAGGFSTVVKETGRSKEEEEVESDGAEENARFK